jgi:undecaprenyl-diphosphatase
MAVLGMVLWLVDRLFHSRRKVSDFTAADALLIGLSQALAIVPGVSRSGATITMARARGIEREDAANFSFLMATPIIAGAGLLETRKLVATGMHAPVLWGFLAAAVFGVAAIAGLIRFVRTRTYQPFAWYRVAVALVVFAVALV